jgi:hypothetical protein
MKTEPTVTITLTYAQMNVLWSMVTQGSSAFEGEIMDENVNRLMEEAFDKCAEAFNKTKEKIDD